MKKQLIILLVFMVTCLYGQQLNQVEYFFDEDPGFGLATSINISPSEDIEIIESLDVSNLSSGFHTLVVRVKDENGEWSSALSKAFYIERNKSEASLLTDVEYFFDEDPGFGLATAININSSDDIEIIDNLDISNLSSGFHTLMVRVKNENGEWSSVLSKGFYIETNNGGVPLLTEVEYFYDQDPGFGNGFSYTEFQPNEQLQLNFLAGVDNLQAGSHEFSIRTKNDLNLWSQTLSQQFELVNCELSISGIITDQEENSITSGFVVLFQSFGEGSAVEIDTIYLSNGSYEFSSVCPTSNYFIKVIPENNNSFLPTYYGDTPYWQEASLVSTQQSSLSNMNITVSSFAEMEVGSSQVKGHIYHAEFRGEPVKNVDVILEMDDELKAGNYLPVAYDKSNAIGEWTMPSLPVGNFRIKVEIPGLEMDTTYHVEIISDNTIIDNLNFYVDFNTGIFIEHIGVSELNLASEIQIFPNPSTGTNLWIQSSNPEIEIEELIIYSYAGQPLGLIEGQQSLNVIDISEFSKGFYLLKIKTNKGLIVQKVIIQ